MGPKAKAVIIAGSSKESADKATRNKGRYDNLPKVDNLFGKKLVCADCGRVIKLCRSISTKKDKAYYNYKCPQNIELGDAACPKKSIKADSPMAKQFADPAFKNMFRNAPAVIFIAHKPGPCTQVDCGLMAGNIVLSAKSLGLGSVCMMGPLGFFSTPEGEPFLKSLGLSEGYQLLLCIGIGYADEQPDARPRKKEVIKFVE